MILSVLLLSVAAVCIGQGAVQFNQPITGQAVSSSAIREASGLAASRVHPGILYTINDGPSSHGNKIYAIDANTGRVNATITLGGALNGDWEALAVGPCGQGASCIFVGDVGDDADIGEPRNIIYRVMEPLQLSTSTIPYMDELEFTWGEPNCGCLMVDPQGNAYIISRVRGGHGMMAKLPDKGWNGPIVALDHLTRLDLNTEHTDPVACDLSPDGKEMLIKAHHKMYYWNVTDGDYQKAIETLGVEVPYHDERTGQAVAWNVLGDGYYTLGEGYRQHLYYTSKQKSTIIG